ncbi:unnamed protein product [Rotaria sp. Silwood2]|nr:unnamed protein product [Rotaria sp. Silwood2]
MQGSYFGKAPFLIDPVTAIKAMATGKLIDVEFVNGCKIKDPDESGFSAAIELARSVDIVIFFGELDQSIEGESVDRTSITVPDIQFSLIHQLEKVVRSSIHVVIMSGSGLDLTYIHDSPQFGSLIWMGYAGQSDGLAISNVVFDQYNPGGRLPITMYSASYVDDVNIDRALERTFNVLTRLGWFDPPEQQFYRQLTKADVDTPQSRKLSLESAQDSIILLKNVNRSMPLHIDPLINKKIALIEPTANATESMQESYFGKTPFLIDPGAAIKAMTAGKLIDVEFMNGCKIKDPDESGFSVAIELARSADIVILFGGLDQSIEGESVDHTSITVPDIQLSLIHQLEKVVRSPIHVVIISDSGLDLTYIRVSP